MHLIWLCYVCFFPCGICVELTNFLKLPVTNRTRMVIDGLLYERAANALMSVMATGLLRQLDDTEKFNLYNCTQGSENNAKYASCLLPYFSATTTMCSTEPRRSKRSAFSNLPPSTLEKTLRWISKLVRALKGNSTSVPVDSTQTEKEAGNVFDEEKTKELLEDRSSKASDYFSDVKVAIMSALNISNPERLLPADLSRPVWFSHLVRNVHEIIDDMKAVEDTPNVRILSPKVFSTKTEPENTLRIFSPELLSLHDHGVNDVKHFEQIDGRLTFQEKRALLDLITEVSSGRNLHSQMEAVGKKNRLLGAQPKYVGKLSSNETIGSLDALKASKELFAKLDPSYSEEQLRTVREKGYAFLRVDQLRLIYGNEVPEQTLQCYRNMSDEQKEYELQVAVADLAREGLNETEKVGSRGSNELRGVLLTPLIQATTVSTPSVLGFVILSPAIFSPLILSPPLLGTTIMSPLIFSPVILTPITLNPIILNPIIMSPFVLSPLTLSPVILTPLVMTPLILFPTALSPIMFVPGVMNVRILSPKVLSPLVYSSQALYAAILSPSFLSPLVKTNCTVCAFVASPCFHC